MIWNLTELIQHYECTKCFSIVNFNMIDFVLCELHFNKNVITENYLNSLLTGTEGNGNPLQYSRLENPMDGGAW